MTLNRTNLITVTVALAMVTVACSDTSATNTTTPTSSPMSTSVSTATNNETFIATALSDVSTITARSEPSESAAVVAELENPKLYQVDDPTDDTNIVFQVIDKDSSEDWVQVKLPIRPNGSLGWIKADEISLRSTTYRIEIDRDEYTLDLYDGEEAIISTKVAIGRSGETATPEGEFYITELLKNPNPDNAYGEFAYGLSGFSEDLDSFKGGEAIIGIHGTNEPEKIGTDASSGCVRLPNEVIAQIVEFLPLGTPVLIT